jgi:hypothetical protein
MTMALGAHEVLELLEILNDALYEINTLRLYRPHVKDSMKISPSILKVRFHLYLHSVSFMQKPPLQKTDPKSAVINNFLGQLHRIR